MNSGATSERVYEALKERILDNRIRPGERIEPAAMAEELSSSVTPVREALNILTGERLLETRAGGGFHVPAIDQLSLSDLYRWNADVLALAIREWPRGAVLAAERARPGDAPDAARMLFAALCALSPNAEHRACMEANSDRLQAARHAELGVVGDPAAELSAIGEAAEQGERALLQRRVAAYHRRRAQRAAVLVRALYRGG